LSLPVEAIYDRVDNADMNEFRAAQGWLFWPKSPLNPAL
jgi:hypothetical protein